MREKKCSRTPKFLEPFDIFPLSFLFILVVREVSLFIAISLLFKNSVKAKKRQVQGTFFMVFVCGMS